MAGERARASEIQRENSASILARLPNYIVVCCVCKCLSEWLVTVWRIVRYVCSLPPVYA